MGAIWWEDKHRLLATWETIRYNAESVEWGVKFQFHCWAHSSHCNTNGQWTICFSFLWVVYNNKNENSWRPWRSLNMLLISRMNITAMMFGLCQIILKILSYITEGLVKIQSALKWSLTNGYPLQFRRIKQGRKFLIIISFSFFEEWIIIFCFLFDDILWGFLDYPEEKNCSD